METLHPQTGPVTIAGKQISSSNATTHGGTSEKLIVPGERREDFDALLHDLLAEYAPATVQARNLVEGIRQLRKGTTLGKTSLRKITIRELIDEGRRY